MTLAGRTFTSLDDIYAALPPLKCRRLCGAYCGPLLTSREEAQRVSGRLPLGTRPDPYTCRFRTDAGECGIYDLRPLICRIWGTTKTLQCSEGCEPERWLDEPEARWLIMESLRIGGGMVRF